MAGARSRVAANAYISGAPGSRELTTVAGDGGARTHFDIFLIIYGQNNRIRHGFPKERRARRARRLQAFFVVGLRDDVPHKLAWMSLTSHPMVETN